MPKNIETKFGEYFNLPNAGLRSYFDIVEKGQPDEYRTTFYRGKSLAEILEGWRPNIEKLSHDWPTLVDFENDLAKKVGPMSIMKPLSERMGDIDSYYEGILLPSEPISERAIKATIREWSDLRGIRLRSIGNTLDKMKKSTNSGSPFFAKRRRVADKTVPCSVWHDTTQVFQEIGPNDEAWLGCAVLGWRGQEGGPEVEDVKQRVVWMFPFAVNIEELRFYQPAIEVAQKHCLVPAWVSMEAVDERITRMFDTKGPEDVVICTDFSKFDQHFGPACQDAAKSIISSLITDPNHRWLNNVFPIKYMIPLAYDYGKIRTGKHGMGSGSGGTNFDETLTHRALQYEAAQSVGSFLNPNSQCLGDDGVLTYPGITVEDVVRSYTAHGLEMNPDKQYVSKQDCVYLRRWHHKDFRVDNTCVGVYSTYRALGRLAEQERYYDPEEWGPKMVALRQLSIIENCKWHPLREEFANYCMEGDKYRLGIDIPGFLDNIEKEAQEAIENMPDFLGYTKSIQTQDGGRTGISEWWIVKYLKSKA
nr:MAG: RNA-dependent RNA polymerase [Porcine picobirnavirus]